MHLNIEGRAGTLRICDGGSGGVPVICVHAFGCAHDHWAAALQRLRRSRRALALDLRGHGGSDAPRDGDFRLEGYVDDLFAALDARGIDRAVFVGNSLGAFTSIAAAIRAPERCAGLFLVDPGDDPGAVPRDRVARVLEETENAYDRVAPQRRERLLEHARPETRALVLPTMESLQPATVLGTLRSLFEFRAADALRTWRGPVFVLAAPQGSGPGALQRVLDLPCRALDRVSHFVHLDAPENFHEELNRFLDAIEKGGAAAA